MRCILNPSADMDMGEGVGSDGIRKAVGPQLVATGSKQQENQVQSPSQM